MAFQTTPNTSKPLERVSESYRRPGELCHEERASGISQACTLALIVSVAGRRDQGIHGPHVCCRRSPRIGWLEASVDVTDPR